MKKPLIIAAAIILGVILSNYIIGNKTNNVTETMVEDTIETKQAADIPL